MLDKEIEQRSTLEKPMNDDSKAPNAYELLRDLQKNEELKHQGIVGSELDPHLALLRGWQSERLTHTYADLLDDSRYRQACLFFLSDIYAPRDFSQRNHDVERIYAFLSRAVPAQMLQLLTDTIELNTMTDTLDGQLLRVLVDKLGVTDKITPELYAEGYRICDNYTERAYQIDLTAKILEEVGKGAQHMVIGIALKMLRGPAHTAGWVELYDFLERGYGAFKGMRDVMFFVDTIREREKHILDEIFSGATPQLTE